MDSIKKSFRIAKQATLQKFGKQRKVEEDPEFRKYVDRYRSIGTAFEKVSESVEGLGIQEKSTSAACKNLADGMRGLKERFSSVEGKDRFCSGLVSLAEMQEEIEGYRAEFADIVAKDIAPPMTSLKANQDQILKFKHKYNTLRYEHDAIVHERKQLLDKGDRASAAKLATVDIEYSRIHDEYMKMQSSYKEMVTKYETGVSTRTLPPVVAMYRAYYDYVGQVYRILHEKKEFFEELERYVAMEKKKSDEAEISGMMTDSHF
ncbi:hypothetical protein ADUPG1_006435 [Aduncisulcus paluster]|uniref:BAR domain-containing protein n=1 Tax=Aduncisulcus paluster TaxID=2918883 RepID=A0ABQ5KI99_9EUKA|nr:hypothetical protein ADUPG1_006435 [Aduncisulcus paluster]